MRHIAEGLEKSIIKSFSGWDGDLEMLQFYEPELVIDIEEVGKAGDIVDTVCIHLQLGVVSFYDDGGDEITTLKFKIVLEDV